MIVDAIDIESAPRRRIKHGESFGGSGKHRGGGRDFEGQLIVARERLPEVVFDGWVERDCVSRVAALDAFDVERVAVGIDFHARDLRRDRDFRCWNTLKIKLIAECNAERVKRRTAFLITALCIGDAQ